MNGCLLKSTLTMSSVTMRVPKLSACCRIHCIISGPGRRPLALVGLLALVEVGEVGVALRRQGALARTRPGRAVGEAARSGSSRPRWSGSAGPAAACR